jgi:hypothetical protein
VECLPDHRGESPSSTNVQLLVELLITRLRVLEGRAPVTAELSLFSNVTQIRCIPGWSLVVLPVVGLLETLLGLRSTTMRQWPPSSLFGFFPTRAGYIFQFVVFTLSTTTFPTTFALRSAIDGLGNTNARL